MGWNPFRHEPDPAELHRQQAEEADRLIEDQARATDVVEQAHSFDEFTRDAASAPDSWHGHVDPPSFDASGGMGFP